MKVMTERQYERRERILATARKLVTEKGYDPDQIRYFLATLGLADKPSDFDFEK